MSLWTLLDGGISMPAKKTFGQKIASWVGYKLATRNPRVHIHTSCSISPEAKINPRDGVISIDENSTVAFGAIVQGNVTIGKNSSVQAYSILVGYGNEKDCDGSISIGDEVRIASHVMIIGADHIFDDPNRSIHSQGLKRQSVVVEDDVWIAGRVNIMAGVRIGRGSVIGAGSVVTCDIPPYSIAVGVPARVIKSRK
jgi:acetyltransferase-like isoleucine patch superfamily enzyme